MRKVTYYCELRNEHGNTRIVPITEHELERQRYYLASQSDKIEKDGFVPVRVTIERISQDFARRERKRSAYFAWLNDAVDRMPERIESMYTEHEKTKTSRVERLHYILKREMCKLHSEYWQHFVDDDGTPYKKVFSLSDGKCHLDEDSLNRYYKWSRQIVEEMYQDSYKETT